MAAFSNVVVPLDAGDSLSLLSRRVVDALRSTPERQRYLRGLRAWVGFRQIGIEVERDARYAGAPKYRLVQLFGLAFDGIFAFSVVPLRAAAAVGVAAIVAAIAFALYSIWAKLAGHESPQGFTALIVALVFLSGVQLFFLGVIGEYVGRAYEESKGRPHYVVRRVVASRGSAPLGSASSAEERHHIPGLSPSRRRPRRGPSRTWLRRASRR
jgi:dolichol-phosphate mannosyltransferase